MFGAVGGVVVVRVGVGSAVLVAASLSVTSGVAAARAVTCDGHGATIVASSPGSYVGTPGDDVVAVTARRGVTVDGGDGDDIICGGPGGDTLEGGPGDDTIIGAKGNDTIIGDELSAPFDPPPARDDDTIEAGPGDDRVIDDWGQDAFVGGAGRDTFVMAFNPQQRPTANNTGFDEIRTRLDIGAGTVTGRGDGARAFADDTLTGFERYVGGSLGGVIIGSAGADAIDSGPWGMGDIKGRGGDDVIVVRAGEYVHGGAGDDTITSYSTGSGITGDSGDDTIRLRQTKASDDYPVAGVTGGPGKDWLIDSAVTHGYNVIDLRQGLGIRLQGRFVREVRLSGIENARRPTPIKGLTTVMIGTPAPNILMGPRDVTFHDGTHGWRSVLRGLGGNDRLLAGPHGTAYGGPGRDTCRAARTYGCEER